MDINPLNTFHGQLIVGCEQNIDDSSENCVKCLKLLSHILFLEQKVSILEDIVNTSNLIAEISQSLSDHQDQSLYRDPNVSCSDVGIQTDHVNPNHSSQIEYDGECEVPQSFMLVNSEGEIEASESLLCPTKQNCYSLLVSPISSAASSETDYETMSYNYNEDSDFTNPCELIEGSPFEKFSLDILLREIDFSHQFKNRKAVYYGRYPYHYTGGSHKPRDFTDGSYLGSICSYLDVLFPNYEYNSVLVNLYESGHDYMPSHSDSEECIEDDSYIVTISLGTTRTIQFTGINSTDKVAELKLNHGDVFVMSKASQMLYQHEIPPDSSVTEGRVSLTFRLVKPEVPARSYLPNMMKQSKLDQIELSSEESGYVPYDQHKDQMKSQHQPRTTQHKTRSIPQNGQRKHQQFSSDRTETVYISSSIFRELDGGLLSSADQQAQVFYYPGANSTEMLQRLLRDNQFQALDKKHVKKVFLLTGTNYVDAINSNSTSLETAVDGINLICCKLWDMFANARLHIINILPRECNHKNRVVIELNKSIKEMCYTHGLSYVDTECINELFSSKHSGVRKNMYFKHGYDNVHLNKLGIARLARHLKYLAHIGNSFSIY